VLVPLAGVGVLQLEQMYPLCIGADLGTTVTALMAALVSSTLESLQVALAHVFFNVTGAVLWYPLPIMRRFILMLSRRLGVITRHWRGFPIFFIALVFFVIPLLLLGISTCFEKKTTGFTALGIFVVLIISAGILYFWIWWRFRSGKERCLSKLSKRRRRKAAIKTLADDIDYIRADIEYCKKEIIHIKDAANIPAIVRMEQGVPVTYYPLHRHPVDEEETAAAAELDENVSLYESCVSVPWTKVLMDAAGSIQDELSLPPRSPSPSRFSHHSARRRAMNASGRSRASNANASTIASR
jgi:hypothetical protein